LQAKSRHTGLIDRVISFW